MRDVCMICHSTSLLQTAPSCLQADALETLFSVPEGLQKHVFSCTPPTLCSQRMQRLLQQQQRQQPHGLWSVCSCFTHEVAATKTKAILLDLGQLVAAQLTCTSLLQNQAVAECGNAASLLKQGNVAGDLRLLLGLGWGVKDCCRLSRQLSACECWLLLPRGFAGRDAELEGDKRHVCVVCTL